MEDLTKIASHLIAHPNGYWIAQGTKSHLDISYPQEGNNAFFSFEDRSFWFQYRNAIITEMVRLFPPKGTFFDIGGGNGYVARGLEMAGCSVVLVEPGSTGALNAIKRGLKHVICATVEAAGFQPNIIPAVGLFDVLEHLEYDLAFLANLKEFIKADGRIYLTVPAFQSLWSAEDDHAGHYRRYSAKSLAKCLEGAGFTVEYLTYFFWFLPLPILFCRTIPSLLGLRQTVSVERLRREFSPPLGIVNLLVNQGLSIERKRIQQKKIMPFGSSCLAVARN